MRRASIAMVAALLVGGVAACSSGGTGPAAEPSETDAEGGTTAPEASTELIKASYGVATSVPTPAQGPYTSLPTILGYWEDEGLDVEVMGFDGAGAVFQAIAANKVDAGQGPPSPLFAAIASGTGLKAFYDHVPKNFLMPQVPEDSDIQSAADMDGATVGVANLEAGGVSLIKAMVAEAGLPPDAIDLVAIGTGAEARVFIERGDVDVVELWDSAYVQLGLPLRPIHDEYFESIGFHNAIVSSAETIASKPDVMVGLARGVAKATLFAHENPEAAVKLHWQVYPESKPVGVDDDVALEQAVAVLEARNVNTQPLDGGWGYSNEEIVGNHMKMLLDAGVLKESVAPEDVWTSDFIEEINDFDADAVRQQAREWTEGS